MATVPRKATAVIIGQGGIVGASVAHHLVELGWQGLVGIDRAQIPTDIGSTSHASDFCFTTSHDRLGMYTTTYSQRFYERMGRYLRRGGMEVARAGDDERMLELHRRVGLGKAFGNNVRLITPQEAAERFPLLDPDLIQGALWDPDAGLVVPRSQQVVAELVSRAGQAGALQAFANTPATGIEVDGGRVRGVHTPRGFIETPRVILCAGIWGPVVGAMAGVQVPLLALEHPLLFFGPMDTLRDTGTEMVHPLFRDQGNSAYARDTGDPHTSEGGRLEWGYYEQHEPRLVEPRDIAEPGGTHLSPSMHPLALEQVLEPLQRGCELMPVLGELGWDERRSFNGLLSITPDGGSVAGESPEVRGLWLAEAVWIKDGPGIGRLLAEWISRGTPERDPHSIDVARFHPAQKTRAYVRERCLESARKIYTPPVHPREPYASARDLRRGPFWQREVELGGYFMEVAGWERAHGYRANEQRLAAYMEQVPERAHEWDARHFWRVSNAEQLAMSAHAGMVNLSHFAIHDVCGPDAIRLLDRLAVADVTALADGQAVYTQFLDPAGGVRADVTITRQHARRLRVVSGADAGYRDLMWMRNHRDDLEMDAELEDLSDSLATLGLWGPAAADLLAGLLDDPDAIADGRLPYLRARDLWVREVPVQALRMSYVGEFGWELSVPFAWGLRLWDLLYEAGAVPVGIETYALSRRLEKGFRLQNAELDAEYNLCEAGLARARVKDADFIGRDAYLVQRARGEQPATLCTLTMDRHIDAGGVARYPVGHWPLLDPASGEVPVDGRGRRSFTTSIGWGPSVGTNILLAYLPTPQARVGERLLLEYFGEHYPVTVAATDRRGLYDPDNRRLRHPWSTSPTAAPSRRIADPV